MSARAFVDTKVPVYAYDRSEPGKQRRALEVLDPLAISGAGVISTLGGILRPLNLAASRAPVGNALVHLAVRRLNSRYRRLPRRQRAQMNAVAAAIADALPVILSLEAEEVGLFAVLMPVHRFRPGMGKPCSAALSLPSWLSSGLLPQLRSELQGAVVL